MDSFKLVSSFSPQGDQPQAIESLVNIIEQNKRSAVLLGVTGSGKTFTLANVIERVKRPTLVISHNKTLAAQLYTEFKEFFPGNAVEYFVSYYDYYQPEAYIPSTDTYIEKDAAINERLDRLRLSATSSLISRKDCLIVASVSCIYNLGSPKEYQESTLTLYKNQQVSRQEVMQKLVSLQYERNDFEFLPGTFRVRMNCLDIFPGYLSGGFRIEFGDTSIEKISEFEPLNSVALAQVEKAFIFPGKHFMVNPSQIETASLSIRQELEIHLEKLRLEGKILEAHRLKTRTNYDLEMLKETGYCNGIENYSRHLSQRPEGSRPFCLIDYFPEDFLLLIDESHITVPQIRGMYEGDRSRKLTLVDYGFRLPSCLDNRPLKFDEFKTLINQVIYVSATPADYEIKESQGRIVEQIIRPTGLVEPEIIIRPTTNQVDDIIKEINKRVLKSERVLITTLTKRMSEDLAEYLKEQGIEVAYLHSEIKTIERTKTLKDLRMKKVDCIVGINLLREGLDLPEVSLVAVLDADKEGFLRSRQSLIQTAGRAARHVNGTVILYADKMTGSIKEAVKEMDRRRGKQIDFNKKHKITPKSIVKAIKDGIEKYEESEELVREVASLSEDEYEKRVYLDELRRRMQEAARNLQFEQAAKLRDQIKTLEKKVS